MASKSIDNLLKRHPTRCAVIVVFNEKILKNSLNLDKYQKYLIPTNMTIGQFSQVLRKKISLNNTQGLFFLINNCLPSVSETIGNLYSVHKNDDDIMYIHITLENTFGNFSHL